MAAASASPAPVVWKVFVGNLSFKTREDQLRDEFAAVTKVVQANIITRGPRSLGYGFVEFSSEEDAKKAVAAMNKKSIDGREINVEIAKPRAEGEAPEARANGERPARGGFRGGFRGGRRRGGAAPSAAPAGNAGGERPEYAPRPRGRGGFRGGRGRRGGAAAGGEGAAAAGGAGGEGAPERAPRTASDTTLFVANLPFSVDDNGLSEIFKEFAPASAHVVIKRNGRSKGFGFVEFKSKDEQAKALAALDGKDVQGRALVVRVAQVEKDKPEGSPAAEHKKDEQK